LWGGAQPGCQASSDGEEYNYISLRDDCTQDGGRRPPLLPSAFAAELETKSFTNGKDDKPLVKRLYEAAFEEQFGKATRLDYVQLGWGDAEAAQLAEVLASGAAPRLEMLRLYENQIGEEGCKALAAALKDGAAPSLKARDAPFATRPSPALCSSRLPSPADAQAWTTRSSLSWWPCARSAASSSDVSPAPAGRQALGRLGARRDQRASTAESNSEPAVLRACDLLVSYQPICESRRPAGSLAPPRYKICPRADLHSSQLTHSSQ